jgi:hypothetical protein
MARAGKPDLAPPMAMYFGTRLAYKTREVRSEKRDGDCLTSIPTRYVVKFGFGAVLYHSITPRGRIRGRGRERRYKSISHPHGSRRQNQKMMQLGR